jgi:hypothetical protein
LSRDKGKGKVKVKVKLGDENRKEGSVLEIRIFLI